MKNPLMWTTYCLIKKKQLSPNNCHALSCCCNTSREKKVIFWFEKLSFKRFVQAAASLNDHAVQESVFSDIPASQIRTSSWRVTEWKYRLACRIGTQTQTSSVTGHSSMNVSGLKGNYLCVCKEERERENGTEGDQESVGIFIAVNTKQRTLRSNASQWNIMPKYLFS